MRSLPTNYLINGLCLFFILTILLKYLIIFTFRVHLTYCSCCTTGHLQSADFIQWRKFSRIRDIKNSYTIRIRILKSVVDSGGPWLSIPGRVTTGSLFTAVGATPRFAPKLMSDACWRLSNERRSLAMSPSAGSSSHSYKCQGCIYIGYTQPSPPLNYDIDTVPSPVRRRVERFWRVEHYFGSLSLLVVVDGIRRHSN